MHTQLLHLSGPLRGRTVTYEEPHLLLGSDPDTHVNFPESIAGIKPRHCEFAFREHDCAIHLRALDGQVFVNGNEIKEIILNHGDLLEFGAGGPRARFRVHQRKGTTCKPVRVMLTDAQDVGRSSGPWAFSQSFIRDLLTHATPQLKIGFPILVLAVLIGVAYLGGFLGGRRGVRSESAAYQEELDDVRKQLQAEVNKRAKALAESEAQVKKLREQLARQSPILDEMQRQNRALQKVFDEYTRGVCLIHGIWGLRKKEQGIWIEFGDPSGKPLRLEYVGSGFMCSDRGDVLTNRHVAQPWWRDESYRRISALGFQPHFVRLTTTFPGKPPLPVDTKTIRIPTITTLDLARMRVDRTRLKDVPVLPIYQGKLATLRGQKVVVLGYPTGLNAVLAKADPVLVDQVRRTARNLTSVIDQLAKANAISPHITQGALNQILERQLVYDALTTSGGSGGPVFGITGEVIGVNAAILRDFSGSNFGVPIRFAKPLLR